MNEGEICNTTLGLGFGVGIKREKQSNNKKMGLWLDLSLTPLHPKIEDNHHDYKIDVTKDDLDSFSSKSIDDQEENERMIKNDNNNNDGTRKKLKLTTAQTTLLEDSFIVRNTLNAGQKQELAKKLNLLPRQIEVWFQNRRARTKLKQIEKEYELLKKYCETLNEENLRLKKELQEIRRLSSSKLDHHHPSPQTPLPFFVKYPATATATVHHKTVKSGEEKKT
ncbi:hypothetical protein E3N88_36002 [Mikania micrantha]|uniref:Homeobox domain-containing protein n=1 Tax=Mikania micrantha TaxID=192012 RepID=A0A5N6M2X3_9ASTR|nr:hypothetical protein E3N88_36002 [Mikania micrantha]